jgi:hypothetical protein
VKTKREKKSTFLQKFKKIEISHKMASKAAKSGLQAKVNYFINNKNDTECLTDIVESFKVII